MACYVHPLLICVIVLLYQFQYSGLGCLSIAWDTIKKLKCCQVRISNERNLQNRLVLANKENIHYLSYKSSVHQSAPYQCVGKLHWNDT